MRLHLYRGLGDERVPKDVTHVIVHSSVTVIKRKAFFGCGHLVSIIMGDSVKRIMASAFTGCHALRLVRLSRVLEFIGWSAFSYCRSLEALFLPPTVNLIGMYVFMGCDSLRLIILPNDIDLRSVGDAIIYETDIHQIAESWGVVCEHDLYGFITHESSRRMNKWLLHHMDEWPFHKLCYNSSVTTKQINDYLDKNGDVTALEIDPYHCMTPLHMLTMNPHAPADAIAALFNVNKQAIFCSDHQQKTPLEYARDYNVGGLVAMMNGLCSHRNSSSIPVELADTNPENISASKRRKL